MTIGQNNSKSALLICTIGEIRGTLTVKQVEDCNDTLRIFCICECGQLVVRTKSEWLEGNKLSCLMCAERQNLDDFTPGDIVIYRNAVGVLPFGSEAIVNNIISTSRVAAVEIEYRGRLFLCRPSELEKLGINFYAAQTQLEKNQEN